MSMLTIMLKPLLGNVKNELIAMIEGLLQSVANERNISVYNLSATVTKKSDIASLEVFDIDANPIYETNAAELIEEIFKKQLATMPDMLKGIIEGKLEGQSIGQAVIDALEGGSLLANYDEKLVMQFSLVTADSVEPIDITDFITKNLG